MHSEKQLVSVNVAHGHNHPLIALLYRCTFSLFVCLIADSVIIATTGSFANSVHSFDNRAYSCCDHTRVNRGAAEYRKLTKCKPLVTNDALPTPEYGNFSEGIVLSSL